MQSRGSTFYGGVPIEQVDFNVEYEKELTQLKIQIEKN